MTPPGRTRASYSLGLESSRTLSTLTFCPQSVMSQPLISPLFGAMTTVVAPASSRALRGSISSACSKPSVARIAIFLPFKLVAILFLHYVPPVGRRERGGGCRECRLIPFVSATGSGGHEAAQQEAKADDSGESGCPDQDHKS